MPLTDEKKYDELEIPIFSSKKSLLPVDEYASRQGISRGVVQECARLGIVQVRKHKNKTFIVDLPLNTYRQEHSGDIADSKKIDDDSTTQTDKILDLVNKIFQPSEEIELLPFEQQKTKQANTNKNKNKNAKPKSIINSTIVDETVELIENQQKLSEQTSQLGKIFHAGKLKTKTAQVINPKIIKEPIAVPDLNLFAKDEKTKQTFVKPQNSFGQLRMPVLRKIIERIKTVPIWKIATATVSIGLFVSICAYLLTSMDRKYQIQKLDNAYAGIQALMNQNENSRQKTKLYQYDLLDSRFQNQQAKERIANQETELQRLKKKLYNAEKNVTVLQQYNAETLEQLNNQIKNITSQLPVKPQKQ